MGLDEIGLSDHYVLAPVARELDWSIGLSGLGDYVQAVQSAAAEAGDKLAVRLGLEADFFPETASALGNLLRMYPFDFVIGAVHFVDGFPIDESAENWERLGQKERDEIMRGYWVRVGEMAKSGLFDFAAHLDLSKRYGFRPSVDLAEEISATLNAIAQADMAVEINTAGWYMPCAEIYPQRSIIAECRRRGIPVLITADAHEPADLTRGFERACGLLRELGYCETASYASRRREMNTLAKAG